LKNTDEITYLLDELKTEVNQSDGTFVSLDVVNLYPSIPLEFGIRSNIEFAELHWQKAETFGLTLTQFELCLKFISYNYEIKFKDKIFKQRKGCPMGAHFAPPFSIITMYKIENEALRVIKDELYFEPKVYN